jgi:hypothetical protein
MKKVCLPLLSLPPLQELCFQSLSMWLMLNKYLIANITT